MNTEITDLDMILNYLETTSLEPHDDYTSEFTYKDQKILYKYIKQLQEENKQLRQDYAQIVSNNCDYLLLEQENKQLKDNWNKVKKYMIDTEQIYKKSDDKYIKDMHEIGIRHAYQTILYKMYVLEQGSDSDE